MAEITVGPGSGTSKPQEPREPGVTPMPGPGSLPGDLASADPVVEVRGLVRLARWSDARVIAKVRAIAVAVSSKYLTWAEMCEPPRAWWRA